MKKHNFPVWKTVTIGVWKKPDALIKTLHEGVLSERYLSSVRFEGTMQFILGRACAMLVQTKEKISLSLATARELTGKNRPTREQIRSAVVRVGELLTLETVFALRMAHITSLRKGTSAGYMSQQSQWIL